MNPKLNPPAGGTNKKGQFKSGSLRRTSAFLLYFFVFCFLFFVGAPNARAAGASLYFSPNTGTFFVGSTFNVSIFVDTGGNDINAIKAELKFDPKKIQITSPTGGKSFISVWVAQPTYSNISGVASFQGGVPSPGINTTAGLVATITFRAIAPGETSIYLSDGSQVLLNDGQGTNILNSLGKGTYDLTIPPPEGPNVYSSTHPDQDKWYKNNSPTFSWDKAEGVTDFSYSIDHDFSGVPDNVSEGDQTSVSYTDLADGIWYFHIKAKSGGSWGGVSTYVVQIDTTPPASFNIEFEPKLRSDLYASQQSIITFITTDAMSGIDHYEVETVNPNNAGGGAFFVEASSPYSLPKLSPGENEIVVRAFDAAGNWQDASKKINVLPSEQIFYATNGGLSLLTFFLPWWMLALLIFIILLAVLAVVISHWKSGKDISEKRKKLEYLKQHAEKNTWINPE